MSNCTKPYCNCIDAEMKKQGTELINSYPCLKVDTCADEVKSRFTPASIMENEKKSGAELISQERMEQLSKHGRSLEDDVKNNPNSEMAMAARYLLTGISVAQEWPRRWSQDWKFKFDHKPHLEKLIIAGALIAAEIDRLNNYTPAPLSEQKQEGEQSDTDVALLEKENLISEICTWLHKKYKHAGVYSPTYYTPPSSIAECIIEWQSQHTAKQIEELKFEVKKQHEAAIYWLNGSTDLNKQIDQYKARIGELEAALRELWPLSTNAFGELSIDEVNADYMLCQLSRAIDKAKELLHPTR